MEYLISIKDYELDALRYMAEKYTCDPAYFVSYLIFDEFDAWFRAGMVEESFFTDRGLDPGECPIFE